MDKLKMHSPDLTQRNIDMLAELFPTVVTERVVGEGDGKRVERVVDFDMLRQELSDHVIEGPRERYQLDWPGKREALFVANAPIAKTMRSVREESVDFDNTHNLFIEGDNLDALKLLQESYLGKVKLIYIDPPYNTGNDFVYADDFAMTLDEYLAKSGQRESDGVRLVANTESNGRFHSDWLSMVYPRFRLARNLLADDGVLFVSIDDHEFDSLVKVGREVFGDRCYLGSVAWLKKRKGSFLSKGIVSLHEYIVAFGRTPRVRLFGGVADAAESQPLVKRTNPRSTLRFPGDHVRTKLSPGEYQPGVYGDGSSAVMLPGPLEVRDGMIRNEFELEGPFVWSQPYLDDQIARGAQIVINTDKLQPRAFKAPDETSHKGLSSVIDGISMEATNEDAYEYSEHLFGREAVLDYPKPVNLMKHLVAAATHFDKDAIVLDYFAGSGTTADAVMRLNADDGGKRQFIVIQLAETVAPDSAANAVGFETIADIAKERLRRVGSELRQTLSTAAGVLDVGFRVLRIDTTNLTELPLSPDELGQDELDLYTESVKPGRTGEDLLFQVLLDWGLGLTMPIEVETIDGQEVFAVEDGALIACFDERVSSEAVRAIASRVPLRAVFRDSGFASDADRINAEQIFAEVSPATDVKVI